jgi:uncharacterized membrane protein
MESRELAKRRRLNLKSNMRKFLFLAFVVLLLGSCSQRPVYPEASFDGKEARIPLTGIESGKPVFYSVVLEGKRINYFIVKSGGDVGSYFDACAKCYPKKLGYRLEGDQVVCRACGVRYATGDLKEGIGSCYPIKLKGRVDGGSYVIDRKALEAGERYF